MRKIGHKDVLAPFPAKQMISTFGNHSVVHTIVNNILMVYTELTRGEKEITKKRENI